ncbi:DNA/RNA non-specific endonuclease [Flavihumibacter fluvii]|uniref:DNA/RNA non-specific endonuclease n=1 Tax=Flavihumibacter fluvii TaxID=2838157 RepID=UPI001BDE7E3B|nr:DNA/RNA non-specific endonuclease [Flavihumibacter fluvii]ULQ51778.1 DNA/RNA non-specific endonuclease [Flavihumibacter fluvii]
MPYKDNFISGYTIPLPIVGDESLLVPLRNGNGYVLDYHHHSVVMNRQRKMAFFTASNIDGESWQPIDRSGDFEKDTHQVDAGFQLGEELYAAISKTANKENDFDQGHLTSFQEVLWGETSEKQRAGADTFYFTNCVPQHSLLNKGAWRSLEQFVTKKAADRNNLSVAVLTGPVMLPGDPYFIKQVNGEFIKVPCAFWKIIYYQSDNRLKAVGFMMSHKNLLLEDQTVTYDRQDVEDRSLVEVEDIFMEFPKAATYQVKVEFIEQVTGLGFFLKGVDLPFRQNESKEIIFKRIEVEANRGFEGASFIDTPSPFELEGLVL